MDLAPDIHTAEEFFHEVVSLFVSWSHGGSLDSSCEPFWAFSDSR